MNNNNCFKNCSYYHYFDDNNSYNCTENDNCPDPFNKLIFEKNRCVRDCKDDATYIYNYGNRCFQICPEGSYEKEDSEEKICFNSTIEGYYLDVINKTYRRCFETCKNCYGLGNETNNNCTECVSNYTFLNDTSIKGNCYKPCDYYYYFDENDIYHCTENESCPEPFDKFIEYKNKCIDDCNKDDTFIYEYINNCYEDYIVFTSLIKDSKDFSFSEQIFISYSSSTSQETYLECFESCETCDEPGSEINNHCTECKSNYTFLNDSPIEGNCYKECKYYYYFDENNTYHCTEDESCPVLYNKLIINKNRCVADCRNDTSNIFNFDNKCYSNCPEGTYEKEDSDEKNCFNSTLEGYYLDLNNKIYKRCFSNCIYCNGPGNETNNNCTECISNYSFLNESLDRTNCYMECLYYYYFDNNNIYHCTKTKSCPIEYNKLLKFKNKCIDDCKNDEIYKYEVDYICYDKCQNGTYKLENDSEYNCFNTTPEGYYLDKDLQMFRKCYKTCISCKYGGNETNNNCIECISNYAFYNNSLHISNCYEKCDNYYYFDNDYNFHCTQNKICPENYNKLIEKTNECTDDCSKDDIYKYEYNNKCYESFQTETSFVDSSNIYSKMESTLNTITEKITQKETKTDFNIENNVSTYIIIKKDRRDEDIQSFRGKLSDYNITKDTKDVIEEKEGVVYQMTTSDNQKNNSNKNVSSINLGTCETKLKEVYKIPQSMPLIIFKIDYYSPDTLIPIIGYEIYSPLNKSKLDLKYCEDILIQLNIPVTIDETKLFKYDPNSGFYTDNCFSYTTENGTDIILNDRKQEFSDNNLSLCESNCNYTGYSYDNKQSSCDCNIKNKMDLISEIIDNPNKLSINFENDESSSSASSNIISIKCTNALFSKDGLKNNISSYILLIFIFQFLLSIMLYIKCGYPLLVNEEIQQILQDIENNEKKKSNKKQITEEGTIGNKKLIKKGNLGKKKVIKKKGIRKKINFPPKKLKLNFVNNNNGSNNNNLNIMNGKKSGSIINNMKNKKKPISNNKNGSSNLLDNNLIFNKKGNNANRKPKLGNKKKKQLVNQNSSIQVPNNIPQITFNEYELNMLEYKYALLFDKRTCFQYYFSLIITKNPILFAFCPRKDTIV